MSSARLKTAHKREQRDVWVACPGTVGGLLAARPTGVPRRALTIDNAAYWIPEIAAWAGKAPYAVEIRATPGHAPRVRIHGNPWAISYATTDGWRVCAVPPEGSIGIDAEAIRSHPELGTMIDLAGKSPRMQHASVEFGWGHAEAFARLWTAKEAVLKALGVGLSIDPRRVEIESVHEAGCRCVFHDAPLKQRNRKLRHNAPSRSWDVHWKRIGAGAAETGSTPTEPSSSQSARAESTSEAVLAIATAAM